MFVMRVEILDMCLDMCLDMSGLRYDFRRGRPGMTTQFDIKVVSRQSKLVSI